MMYKYILTENIHNQNLQNIFKSKFKFESEYILIENIHNQNLQNIFKSKFEFESEYILIKNMVSNKSKF